MNSNLYFTRTKYELRILNDECRQHQRLLPLLVDCVVPDRSKERWRTEVFDGVLRLGLEGRAMGAGVSRLGAAVPEFRCGDAVRCCTPELR